MATIFFLVILLIATFLTLIIYSIYLIHKLQLLGYKNQKFIKWLESRNFREVLVWDIFELLFPLFLILVFYFTINPQNIPLYKYITATIISLVFLWKLIHPFIKGWIGPLATKNVKKPLKWTSRVIRLFITLNLLSIVILVFGFIFTAMPLDVFTLSTWAFFKFNAFLLFVSVISPIIVIAANFINFPIEKLIQFFYWTKAKNKLLKANLFNIGITGSYGKTSTKFFLATILAEKYKTLFTPASFNTPMGISKVVNEEKNLNDYKYFVVEMGADHLGEIDYLCKLVKINCGILTAIGLQHLETFGSIKNIIKTKFAILVNILENGFGIYNYDSPLVRENINIFPIKAKLYCYSLEEKDFSKVNVYATDIRHTRSGLEFKAFFDTGEVLDIKTELLGSHNASNLLAAMLCAKVIGLTKEEIEEGIKKIKPVEHRLQRIDAGTGVLVLDDAFNSNLAGATEALKILKEIDGNKKIIVTPGLVELGEKEDEQNKIFGNRMANYVDYAILIGKEKTKKIYEGLIELNFNKDRIIVVSSLNEARGILQSIVKPGDVVLFENDLPDTFNEK